MPTLHAILTFPLVLLEVILIFNLLIVVHELGHFLAARWRGLVVEKFGIWFGKPLWKRTIGGVQYSLGSIPFGGFVALPQLAPMDMIEGETTTDRARLPRVSPLDKIIVALAGPVFSFGLAVVFAVIVYLVGRPVSEAEQSTTIGYVVPDSPASAAPCDTPGVPNGLRPGDQILKVDNHPVSRFGGMSGSVVWYIARSEEEQIPFEVRRGEQTLTFRPTPRAPESESVLRRKSLRQVLIDPAFSCIVAKVEPGSPGDKAGLKEGDVVTAVNGERLLYPLSLADGYEQDNYGKPLTLQVERNHQLLTLTLAAMPLKVGSVLAGGPAERAGLKKGDAITALDGSAPAKFSDLNAAITAHGGQPLAMTISRDGKEQTLNVTPLVPKGKSRAMIGIGPDDSADGINWRDGGVMKLEHEKPSAQIYNSVATIGSTIGAVFAPKSHIGVQHLGGPVFIGRTYFYLLSSEQGWRLALWFSVVLNVNLALLNLLPIPVLDGGHIVLALIESVRRRPVNIRVLEIVQTACFILIAGYMLYVSFYDVGDLAGGRKGRQELEFPSPTPAAAKP